jgi:hypothetical protein
MTMPTDELKKRPRFAVLKSRFWLAHRNGQVAAESGCERERANPYRKHTPSYRAFFESFDETRTRAAGEGE